MTPAGAKYAQWATSCVAWQIARVIWINRHISHFDFVTSVFKTRSSDHPTACAIRLGGADPIRVRARSAIAMHSMHSMHGMPAIHGGSAQGGARGVRTVPSLHMGHSSMGSMQQMQMQMAPQQQQHQQQQQPLGGASNQALLQAVNGMWQDLQAVRLQMDAMRRDIGQLRSDVLRQTGQLTELDG